MPIVDSIIVIDRPQADGTRKILEEHTDHIGLVHRFGPRLFDSDYDEVAGLALHAIQINDGLKLKEINDAISSYENDVDPLHFEQSPSNWQKIIPIYNDNWDALATPILIDFLSREEQLELVYIETTIVRITTNDKKILLGMTNTEVNNVNSDIQIAVNTRTTLDDYSPHFIDGVKV